jgi:hypothetical protein
MLQVGAAPDNCLEAWRGQIMPLANQQRCAPGLFAFDQNGIPFRISSTVAFVTTRVGLRSVATK